MKKLTAMMLVICLLCITAGCAGEQSRPNSETETDAAETAETTVPPATVQETEAEYLPLPPDAPGGAESLTTSEAEALSHVLRTDWWYHMLLSVRFAAPEEVDLQQLFSHSYERDGDRADLTEAEKQFLFDNLSPGALHEKYTVSKTPRETVDMVLLDYLGKTLDEMAGIGMDRLFYCGETDTYIGNSTERPLADGFSVKSAYRTEDGLITVIYDVKDSQGNELVLAPKGDQYQAVSNVWPMYDGAERFTDAEIEEAIQIVRNEFMFPDCNLETVWYDNDVQLWQEQGLFYGKDTYVGREHSEIEAAPGDVIVILSNIYSRPDNDSGVMQPDMVYTEYHWILSRANADSPWYLQDWGY